MPANSGVEDSQASPVNSSYGLLHLVSHTRKDEGIPRRQRQIWPNHGAPQPAFAQQSALLQDANRRQILGIAGRPDPPDAREIQGPRHYRPYGFRRVPLSPVG